MSAIGHRRRVMAIYSDTEEPPRVVQRRHLRHDGQEMIEFIGLSSSATPDSLRAAKRNDAV